MKIWVIVFVSLCLASGAPFPAGIMFINTNGYLAAVSLPGDLGMRLAILHKLNGINIFHYQEMIFKGRILLKVTLGHGNMATLKRYVICLGSC